MHTATQLQRVYVQSDGGRGKQEKTYNMEMLRYSELAALVRRDLFQPSIWVLIHLVCQVTQLLLQDDTLKCVALYCRFLVD